MRATIIAILILLCVFSLSSSAKLSGYRLVKKGQVVATAYNSLASQTDSTPWITASGTRCREGVIASNFLPMGTKVMIEGFGNKVFTVEDRMNCRFSNRIDIWFLSYHDAIKFGKRQIKYYVLDTV